MAREDGWVCLGVIGRPHGVRGLVRIRPFTENARDVAAYGPVTDRKTGREYTLTVMNLVKDMVTVRIEGVEGRDQADALKGTELWVRQSVLPEVTEEEAYYHHNIIGLTAEDMDGKSLGEVVAVENYGAGDLLELRLVGAGRTTVMVPFTRECVPVVDVAGHRVVIDAPAGMLDDEDEDPGEMPEISEEPKGSEEKE
jgi:16S rRNA processing protein RimM